jgi:hypothetical protein
MGSRIIVVHKNFILGAIGEWGIVHIDTGMGFG